VRIDARHLLQHSFAISNVRDARGWLLFLCIQMLVERFNNCIFNVSSRNAGNRSDSCCFGFSVQERKRDIVAIAYAGLGRMGRDHTGDVAFSLHGAVGVLTEQHHADAAEDDDRNRRTAVPSIGERLRSVSWIERSTAP
jgi:hypothetical protein